MPSTSRLRQCSQPSALWWRNVGRDKEKRGKTNQNCTLSYIIKGLIWHWPNNQWPCYITKQSPKDQVQGDEEYHLDNKVDTSLIKSYRELTYGWVGNYWNVGKEEMVVCNGQSKSLYEKYYNHSRFKGKGSRLMNQFPVWRLETM